MKNLAALIFISFFFLIGASNLRYTFRIGIIDIQKILDVSKAGKKAQTELSIAGKKMEEELRGKFAEIQEIQKNLDQENIFLNDQMKQEKQHDLKIMKSNLRSLRQKYIEDYNSLENQLTSRIQKEIVDLVRQIGKNGQYDMIVEKRVSGVLYTPSSYDITDVLIHLYDEKDSTHFNNNKLNKFSVNSDYKIPDSSQVSFSSLHSFAINALPKPVVSFRRGP